MIHKINLKKSVLYKSIKKLFLEGGDEIEKHQIIKQQQFISCRNKMLHYWQCKFL